MHWLTARFQRLSHPVRFSLLVSALWVGTILTLSCTTPSPPPTTSGKTYYADNRLSTNCTGNYSIANRTCSGSDGTAFRTIQQALDTARGGDTVLVRGGTTYHEQLKIDHSGTAGNPITYKNSPGETPVIDADCKDCIDTGKPPRRPLLLQDANGYQNPIGWIVVEGLEMANGWDGMKMYNAHDVIIRHNSIHDNEGQGILGNGYKVTIDANTFVHNGGFGACSSSKPSVCNKDHGVYMTGTSITITHNIFSGNLSYGVQMAAYPYKATDSAGQEYSEAHHWLIAQNTFVNQQHRAGVVVWLDGATDSVIENNIFSNNCQLEACTAQGIDFYYSGGNHVVRNNLYYDATGKGAVSDTAGGASYTESGGIVNRDPLFVNATAGDFHLQSSSPGKTTSDTGGEVGAYGNGNTCVGPTCNGNGGGG